MRDSSIEVEAFVSARIRQRIEQMYYARVNVQARLEHLMRDPAFLPNLGRHVGLFSDHGIVHVRDVARQILQVLERAHGRIIPTRSALRLSRMKGYGALVAYLHDIGMRDFSEFGRRMHPEFAARALFSAELQDVFEAIWEENSGNLAWHLTNLTSRTDLGQPAALILREMLAMSICHSKSKVPSQLLNDLPALRGVMLDSIGADLHALYEHQQNQKHPRSSSAAAPGPEGVREPAGAEGAHRRHQEVHNPDLTAYYDDFGSQAFQWLITDQHEFAELQQDVIDTLRALRCADALRQRGTLLTTSGEYEIFVDQRTANAVFGLRLGADQLYLLELPDEIAGGEANIASSELDPQCDLRISFHRGAFSNRGATARAARSAARVVYDIQQDVIGSWERALSPAGRTALRRAADMKIMLEETDDNPMFVDRVAENLAEMDATVGQRVRSVPSLNLASERERDLYLDAPGLDWDLPSRQSLLRKLADSGHLVDQIEPQHAFADVKEIELEPGQVLLDAGALAAFVYIPLDPGLKIIPDSGHASFLVEPWMPLGVTAVIRGATRSATVRAESAVRLLMIPKSVYLRHWHSTHSPQSFAETVNWISPPRSG